MTQEIITITVEAGQMTARRKSRKIAQRRPVPVWAIVKYAALTIAGIMLFREGAARALAYRGYSPSAERFSPSYSRFSITAFPGRSGTLSRILRTASSRNMRRTKL